MYEKLSFSIVANWLGITFGTIGLMTYITYLKTPPQVISPLPDNIVLSPTLSPTPIDTKTWSGKASYYSEAGCLGCNAELIMANGEKLDDHKATIALPPQVVKKHKLLNKEATVTNNQTGDEVRARITDTGGFAKYNRVADLSVKTKEELHCTDLCDVTVEAD